MEENVRKWEIEKGSQDGDVTPDCKRPKAYTCWRWNC